MASIDSLSVFTLRGAEFHQSNLSAVAVVKSKPYVHQSKAGRLEQEEVQEEGNAPVGPAPVDQQQPLQEPELGQRKVGILHRLASFHSCNSHTDVRRWGWGRTGDRWERVRVEEAPGYRSEMA